MKTVAVINAQAGLLKGVPEPNEVRTHMEGLNADVDIWVLNDDPLEPVIAKLKADPPSTLILAGGDGTVAAFWRAFLDTDITFGIVPTGSLNNIATSLGIPDDPQEAVAVINAGKTARVDVGQVDGGVFFESVGVGLLADIMERIGEQDSKKEVVKTALASAAQIAQADPFMVEAIVDGQRHTLETMWLTVTNSGRAAAVEVDPTSDMTDGVLELTYCKPIGLTDLPQAINTFLLNTHVSDGPFERLQGQSIKLIFDAPAIVHIDGDVTTRQELTIEVRPRILKVLVP